MISIRPNLDFRLEGYAFKALETIKQTLDQQPQYHEVIEDIRFAGTAGLILHSPIGPINLSLNYYDDAQTRFGVLLHVGFLLFQDKSME